MVSVVTVVWAEEFCPDCVEPSFVPVSLLPAVSDDAPLLSEGLLDDDFSDAELSAFDFSSAPDASEEASEAEFSDSALSLISEATLETLS